jgi:hypothetical protein
MPEQPALSISGRELNYEFRMVDISDLHFFEDNPRVATIVSEHKEEVSDEIIDQALWQRPETHKWYRRIQKDGGLIHPLIVYDGKVLEGNTRLCCYRHLYEETKDSSWTKVKCHVITDSLTRTEIYRLLCTEHIEGKIDWDAYDKANMYRKMKDEDEMTLEQISELSGESTGTVANKIRAYKLMVENGVIEKDKYSHFEQLVMNGEIRGIKKDLDPQIEEKVIRGIKKGTIRTAPDIRLIPSIYKHKEARKRFMKFDEDVQDIYYDLKAKAPMTDSPLMCGIEDVLKRVRALTREQRDAIAKNGRDRSKVEQLTKEMIGLCMEMDVKIHIPKKKRSD